ncbi:MAG: acyl-CoA dehydrogenase family protein [Candidatus Hodarchaeota archaeon]
MKDIRNAVRVLNYDKDTLENFDMVLELADEIAQWLEPYAREINEAGLSLENGKVKMHEKGLEALKKIKEAELLALTVPEEYDGAELPFPMSIAVFERLARADAGIALPIGLSQFAIDGLITFGTPEAKEKYLTEFAQGKRSGCMLLSEPQSGSDLGSVKTKIIEENDHFIVNGQKIWISNAGLGNTFLLLGSMEPEKRSRGLSALIIDANTPGVTIDRLEEKLGLHSSPTGVVSLQDAKVPKENLLGERNKGFAHVLRLLTSSRLGIAGQAIGIAEAAYRKTLEYVKQRKQFGIVLADMPVIQSKLAEMKMGILCGRSAYLYAATLQDKKLPFSTEGAAAKAFCSETANRICYDAIQLHGGNGYITEFDVERYYRDVRVTTIYEGTTQVQKLIISRNEINGVNY